MAHSTDKSTSSSPGRGQQLWLILLSRPVIGLLLILLAVLIGAGWRAWIFVWQELPPVVEKNLSQTLNRPVQLGRVKEVSLTSLKFGPSSIPRFTKQVGGKRLQDRDRASVKAVDVVFNPLDLLQDRTLRLDITLEQPDLYFDQTRDGRWISTPITTQESKGPIKTKLQAVRFRQARAVLVPQGTSPQTLHSMDGSVLFTNENQRLQFDVAGQFAPGGTLNVKGQWLRATQKVTLTAQGQDLPARAVAELIKLPAAVKAGRVRGKINVQVEPNQPLSIEGSARIYSADAVVPDQYLLRSLRPTPRSFRAVNGTVELADRSQKIRFDLQGQVVAGGRFNVKGQWLRPTQQINLALRAQDLAAKVLDKPFKLPISASAGKIDGNLRVQLRPNKPPNLQGTAQLKDVTGRISQLPTPLTKTTGQLRFKGLTTTLENVRGLYGKIPLQASGTIDPQQGYNVAGQTEQITVASVRDTFALNLPFTTAGSVQGQNLQLTGPLTQPRLTGLVTDAATVQVDQLEFQNLLARFELKAPVLRFTQIRAVPTAGGVVTGDARLNVLTRDNLVFNLQAQQVPGDAIAQRYGVSPAVKIGPVSAQAQISGPPSNLRTAVQFQAPEATYPGTGSVLVSGGKTLLRDINLRVAGGRVNVDGRLADNQLQATVAGSGVQLQRFSPDLRGLFSGRLNVSAPLASLRPEAVRAQGQVRFSEGLSLVQEPLTAQVRWDGEKILVQRATAPGFSASGAVFAKLQGPQAPRITALNLNVQTEDYSLQNLPLRQIPGTQLVGLADFAGRLTGTATAPNLRGTLRVDDLALNQVTFEPSLTGRLSYQGGQGLDLQLAGTQDRVDLALGANLRPESFYVRRDAATAVGRTEGERLLVNLQRFPLAALNLTPSSRFNLGPVAGLVSGDFDVNVQTFTGGGTVAIAQPRIGGFTGETFTGRLRYENGVAALSEGVLRQAGSQYGVSGTFTPGSNPQFTAQVQLAQAEVQDILTAFNWFNLADVRRGLQAPSYGQAADIQTLGIETSEAPLLTQIRRLSEIEALLAQQVAQRREASPLPDLADLQGVLQGQVEVSGSQRSGIALDFNLRGQEFDWGPYNINQLVAEGRFANGVLELQPLRLQSGESLVAFSGQVGGSQQSGQLQAENVPVDVLQDFVELPIDVAGKLDATATLAGSLANPQAQGAIRLEQATLQGTPVKTARGDFNYDNARLNFGSTVVVSAPEPVQITGSIPYQLPFASEGPESNQLSLDLNVRDEGLALLNVLTRQVDWVNGKGRADLQVRGTLDKPLVDGVVTIADATLRAQALSQPLTDVTGTIRFDRDRLQVERLTGRFSQGQVIAAGGIPIFTSAPVTPGAAPLTVELNNLALQLEGLYTGGVNGNVRITGAVQEPVIGGMIQLSDGRVLLSNQAAGSNAAPGPATSPVTPDPAAETDTGIAPLQFNNLRVALGQDVQVTRPPILNFLASGDLILNGSANNFRPQGIVRFQQGQVNLFTTRFRIDRQEPNYAEFKPEQGLDPNLNVSLATTVTEVVGSRVDAQGVSEAAPFSALGALDSVRIEAEVTGRASRLFTDFENNVELTSSPSRDRDQIIALIGGGLDGAGEGESTLALANLASSAFLNNFQGLFDNALGGKVDFRLFPTLIPTESETSNLNLGAEIGYDVTGKASVSVLQVLTAPENSTQFGARYQLNDKVNLRGTVNLEGDGAAAVEYRTRF